MTIRALLLDLGDTVFGLGPYPTSGPEAVIAQHLSVGSGEVELESARRLMTSYRDRVLADFALGVLEEHQPAALFGQLAREAGLHLAPDSIAAIEEALGRADISRFLRPEASANALATFRQAGLALVAVSNTTTSPALLKAFLEEVGLLESFDALVFSIELGVRKPHERMYREALGRAGVAPKEALFVGDRVREDVVGPQSCGIHAVLTHEFRQEDPGSAQPTAIVGSLAEVLELVPEL
ncbi:MAG: HAD family hydrolase [Dehalococcoidia bacterium]